MCVRHTVASRQLALAGNGALLPRDCRGPDSAITTPPISRQDSPVSNMEFNRVSS
jgi:hypothetical protein